jgi:localization factor PodJL
LRGELVALLDQVEGGYATRRPAADPQVEGLARRVRALRSQVVETPGTERRREALRSVKRAVYRFSDRDDNGAREPDELRAAIAEIRARQTAAQAPILGRRGGDGGELAELTGLVSGLSSRLEKLETELHGLHQDAGGVREIAMQVEQLTQVIELVAGAVGETGQVKRLEAQLASLARLVADTPRIDLDAVNDRLDELATTVGKLAELQVQQMEREIVRDESPPASDPALGGIEEGIRNVYDRIDTIEKNVGLSQGDLERITSEMAALTAAIPEANSTAGPPSSSPRACS